MCEQNWSMFVCLFLFQLLITVGRPEMMEDIKSFIGSTVAPLYLGSCQPSQTPRDMKGDHVGLVIACCESLCLAVKTMSLP